MIRMMFRRESHGSLVEGLAQFGLRCDDMYVSQLLRGVPTGMAADAVRQHESGPEWPAILDVDSLLAAGWHPTPFRQFLLKIHSRCNLACDYCYVYTMADQTWRNRPRVISPALISVTAERIAEHARAHSLDSVRIIFHGGEPLLSGVDFLEDALRKIRAAVDARVHVEGSIQTNGTLLNEAALNVLSSLDIRVGVSLDGDMAVNDKRRRYRSGRGSYTEVVRALKLLAEHPRIYSGLLSVVDLEADPVETFEALLEFAPPAMDFLLPHHNWMYPPPRPSGISAPYAQWLIEIFDRWYGASSQETHVRLFEEIIHLLLGGVSESEAVGLTPSSVVVIETDGSIEQSDALKAAYEGASATGLHIVRDSFDAALRVPHFAARQLGLAALGDDCQVCPIKMACGAGLYAHRYRRGSGFRNRSVYCPDLYALITHIRARITDDLKRALGTLSEQDRHLNAEILALSGSCCQNFRMFVPKVLPVSCVCFAC